KSPPVWVSPCHEPGEKPCAGSHVGELPAARLAAGPLCLALPLREDYTGRDTPGSAAMTTGEPVGGTDESPLMLLVASVCLLFLLSLQCHPMADQSLCPLLSLAYVDWTQ